MPGSDVNTGLLTVLSSWSNPNSDDESVKHLSVEDTRDACYMSFWPNEKWVQFSQNPVSHLEKQWSTQTENIFQSVHIQRSNSENDVIEDLHSCVHTTMFTAEGCQHLVLAPLSVNSDNKLNPKHKEANCDIFLFPNPSWTQQAQKLTNVGHVMMNWQGKEINIPKRCNRKWTLWINPSIFHIFTTSVQTRCPQRHSAIPTGFCISFFSP